MMGGKWTEFLTGVEKQWLENRPRKPAVIGPRSALLMIDLYRGGFGDKPEPLEESLKNWPWSCGLNGWRALPNITRLLDRARSSGLPVIHITMRDPADGLLGWIEARQGSGPGALTASEADAETQRRATRIIEEVAPLPGEAVIEKSAPSAFWGTPLVGHLKQLDVDTLIVAGMTTSGCVRATTVDGAANRLRMIVVEDCVFDRFDISHAVSLFDLQCRYAEVVSLNSVEEIINRSRRKANHENPEIQPKLERSN